MWLKIPSEMPNVLWEGQVVTATDQAVEQLQRDWRDRGHEVNSAKVNKDLPVVTIGRPDVWPLPQVYPPDKMPRALRAKIEADEFFFVRLYCSFRPKHDEANIEWARFVVHLMSDEAGHQPVAFDLHPLMVTHEIKRSVKVALSPSVKFEEVEASLGGVEFGFEYPELQPVISAAGAGESIPSWDYEAVKGLRLQGSKFMHLLVKAPKGTSQGKATLDLTADMRIRQSRLAVLLMRDPKRVEKELTIQLW